MTIAATTLQQKFSSLQHDVDDNTRALKRMTPYMNKHFSYIHSTLDRLDVKTDRILATMATKDDIAALSMATRDDIAALSTATKNDIAALSAATKSDIAALAMATREDIAALSATTQNDIAALKDDTVHIQAQLNTLIKLYNKKQ